MERTPKWKKLEAKRERLRKKGARVEAKREALRERIEGHIRVFNRRNAR